MKLLSAIFVLALTASASATPIQPDIKKLLDQPRPVIHYVPARAGWYAPEAASSSGGQAAAIERAGFANHQRGVQQSLLRVATPDWRIFLALGALILLLRMLQQRATGVPAPATYTLPVDAIEPERQRPAA